MGDKVIIEENTIYEIDDECVKKMEKQKIVMNEMKNRTNNKTSSKKQLNCKKKT